MKKYLLFIISMVCAVTGAWAGVTLSDSNPYMVLTTTTAGDIYTGFDAITWFGHSNERIGLKIVGPINQDDIDKLASFAVTLSTEDGIIDFCGATFEGNPTINTVSSKFKVMRVPVSYSLEDNSIPATVDFAFSTDATRQRYWNGDEEENEVINLSVNTGGLTQARTILNSSTYGFGNFLRWRKVNLISGNYTSAELTAFSTQFNEAGDQPVVTIISNEPYEVSGCAVTINMAKAEEGQTLADLIALAKTAMTTADPTQTNICTLTVQGKLTNDDLIALGGTNMTGATRIDLSGATIASGSSIENIALPASLEQLVLPKGMLTISDALKSKFAQATNLWYAYSPTSQEQTRAAQTTSPDLVWVNKSGGLNLAICKESKLRTGVYVKVESTAALNADDIDLATNKYVTGYDAQNQPTYSDNYTIKSTAEDETNFGWQYVDFGGANLQQDVCLSYTKPHEGSYRIIMPDGWSGDQLAILASLGSNTYGGLAAVYSYTSQGYLQILETDDTKYSRTALQDGRIVRSGTKAIRVINGTYNGNTYGSFGQLKTETSDEGNRNLFDAINIAASSIEAVTITNVNTASSEPLTFTNKNLIYIQLDRVKSEYDDEWKIDGPIVNVDECTKLQTLNILNCQIKSITARVSASADPVTTGLTKVNMTGTGVNGNADFSKSPITSFTTTSDTEIKGNLDLTGTALTTFSNALKVGTNNTANTGDIILNETPLNSLALNQVVFQYGSSIVYVRKSANSSSSNYETLTGSLDDDKETIIVPVGFESSTRIIPYKSSAVKQEEYVAPAYAFTDTDMYLHEAETTGSNPDKFVYWYTGTNQSQKVLTITMTDERRGTLSTILSNASVTSSTNLVKVKIDGPLASNDLAALANLNTQILDLSGATLQKETSGSYEADNTILNTESAINSYAKFLILPPSMITSETFYNTSTNKFTIANSALSTGFTGLYSAIALTDYNTSNNFDFVAYNKVRGTLQPAVVAAGRGTINGSQMIRGEEGSERTAYYPTMSGNVNRNATISGQINAYDLTYNTKLSADGHLSFNKRYADEALDNDDRTNNGTETNIYGAFNGSNGPLTLDLRAAEIEGTEYINDICISYLVPTNYLKYLIIPETSNVKETPSYFIQHNLVKEICIPSNIEVIRTHFAPSLDHIWTTSATNDVAGTRYDNGAYLSATEEASPTGANYGYTNFTFTGLWPCGTYTFSSNLKMIETGAFANTTPHVKDVYVLAKTAPECHVDAFCVAMYIGNSGFAPNIKDGVITRDSYVNGSNWITMLHYPRECVTPQVQRYTDPTRSYTIASNEVDGKGGVLYYPNYGEFLTAYAQGTTGYLWNAWPRTYEYGMLSNSLTIGNSGWTADWQRQANEKYQTNIATEGTSNTKFTCTSFYDVTLGGNTKPASLVPYNQVTWNEKELKQNTSGSASTPEYFLYPTANTANESTSDVWNDGAWTWNVNVNDKVTSRDYRGWHQFVLNAFAANTNVPVQPNRSYITESRWYTICLPYDLTWEEMLLFYGSVTASGNTTTVDKTKLPYLCLLSNVVRDEQNTHITLNFSKNLMEYAATKSNDGVWTVGGALTDEQKKQSGLDQNGKNTGYVVLHAGVPYLIKPNLTSDPIRQFDIYKADQNLSDYTALSAGRIMVSCAEGGYPGLYEKLKAAENMNAETFCATLQNNMYTVPGLLPVTKTGDNTYLYPESNNEQFITGQDEKAEVETIGEGENAKYYYRSSEHDYTFIGSFMMNILPPYCYYLGYKSSTKTTGFYYADYLKLEVDNAIRKVYENQMLWVNNQAVICPNLLNTTSGSTDATTAAKNKYNLGHTGAHNGLVTKASGTGENMRPARWEIFSGAGPITSILPEKDLWTTQQNHAPAMMFGMDITGVNNGTTSIRVNGVDVTTTGGNVYSLNGQLVGTSLEGLAKGIYIVNGKKVMVK